jgi:hypothetical protein
MNVSRNRERDPWISLQLMVGVVSSTVCIIHKSGLQAMEGLLSRLADLVVHLYVLSHVTNIRLPIPC